MRIGESDRLASALPRVNHQGVNPETVQSLVQAIERKDALTAAHTWRVVLYSRALAEARGVDHATIARVTQAAALHDIGKLDIPDAILQKPGKLTEQEFEIINTHPAAGHARLLALGETDEIVLNLVRHHHERIDGRGYPDGLTGESIGLGPAIFSVIDSFDALTSIRPYRQDVGEAAAERAIEELYAAAGTRYCPEAVRAFDRIFRSGELGWILEHFNDRCPVHPFTAGEIVGTLAHPLRKPR